MPIGPGKYDDLCLRVLSESGGHAAVVIVVHGSKGSGVAIKEDFSVAGGQYHLRYLPKMLRLVANEIEETVREGKGNGNGKAARTTRRKHKSRKPIK